CLPGWLERSSWRSFPKQLVQLRAHRAQRRLRLGSNPDFLENVVDHLTECFGLIGIEEQGTLGATFNRDARVQAFDRRCFAVWKFDTNGAVLSVDLDHRGRSVQPGLCEPRPMRLACPAGRDGYSYQLNDH